MTILLSLTFVLTIGPPLLTHRAPFTNIRVVVLYSCGSDFSHLLIFASIPPYA